MPSILELTSWLREESDLTAARLVYLMRDKGVDPKTLVCAKISPDRSDPTGGVVITPQGQVYQFAFNRAGMIVEMAIFDEWLNITSSVMGHPWRDDILAGLAMIG